MLYLKEPSQNVLDEYFLKLKKTLEDNISKSDFTDQVKDFLNSNLEDIIKLKPELLIKLNDDFFKIYFSNRYSYLFYKKYLIITNTPSKSRTIQQKLIYGIYKKRFDKVNAIFNYEKILSKSKAYWLANKINVNTCVYCNRLYSNVIEIDGGKNNDNRIARPFFDHWFSKSKHPILALSFYNLIPSCSVCNSSIKGSIDFDISTHIHPYNKQNDEGFKFSYQLNSLKEPVVIIRDVNSLNTKTIKTIEDFKIKEVYNSHSDKELKDLIDLANKYPNKYLKTLFTDTFKDLNMSEEEIYRMIFGIETKEEDYHKRPFSKFKHDIIEELKNIK